MSITPHVAGANASVSRFSVQIAGALKPLRKASVYSGDTLRLVFNAASALSLSAAPNPAQAHPPRGSTTAEVSVAASPTGGLGPFSYHWETVSFVGAIPIIATPSFASTSLLQAGLSEFDANECVFRCTVTDSLGATASVTVNVTFFGPIDDFSHL